MIVSSLIGGLGNQLFQYATGYALSQRLGTEHKLDITAFSQYKLHKYSLHNISISAPIATVQEINKSQSIYERSKGKYRVATPLNKINDQTQSYRLHGYWLNEQYFMSHREALISEFKPRKSFTARGSQLLQEITNTESVSVHVRRKDFLHSKERVNICTPTYYTTAINLFPSTTTLFIFSDDIEWVKNNPPNCSNEIVFVDHNNADRNFEDLYLMSHCKHNIIANSTFSWWGAWLNTNPDKIIVYPSKWSNKEKSNAELVQGIIPNEWRRRLQEQQRRQQ